MHSTIIPGLLILLANFLAESRRVPIDYVHISCLVHHRYLKTSITANIKNPLRRAAHLPFKITLPDGAAMTSLSIMTKEENITSIIVKKDEKAETSSKTLKMTLKNGSNHHKRFTVSKKINKNEEVTYRVEFEQLLKRNSGHYTLNIPLPEHQLVNKMFVDITIQESVPLDRSVFNVYPLPWDNDGSENAKGWKGYDVTFDGIGKVYIKLKNSSEQMKKHLHHKRSVLKLEYDVERQPDSGEIKLSDRRFVHFLAPEGLPKLPTHTIFVLDISGSMMEKGKLNQLKKAMKEILKSLKPEDSFEVIVFSSAVHSLGFFTALPADINLGIEKIDRLQPFGGTNINDALLKALREAMDLQDMGAMQVVFLTDGKPTVGEKDPVKIRANVRKANVRRTPIFSLAFGNDADMLTLRKISAENRGLARKIRSTNHPAEDIKKFYDEISTPLLAHLEIIYPEDQVLLQSIQPATQATFYEGSEIVVVGELKNGSKQVNPVIKAVGERGPLQLKLSRTSYIPDESNRLDRDNVIDRFWAYMAVQDLLSLLDLVDNENVRNEMYVRAIELALQEEVISNREKMYNACRLKATKNPEWGNTNFMLLASPTTIALQHPNNLSLLKPEEIMESSLKLPAPTRSIIFADNDPHFVVQVSGIPVPLCFDLHGKNGEVINLVDDNISSILVNGQVTSAVNRPHKTYFTKIFFDLGNVNITVAPPTVEVVCNEKHHFLAKNRSPMMFQQPKSIRDRKSSNFLRKHYTKNRPTGPLQFMLHRNIFSTFGGGFAPEQKTPATRSSGSSKNCGGVYSWKDCDKLKFGDVLITSKGRKRLNIARADLNVHFSITHSKRQYQSFLGFYIEEKKGFSTNVSGIIGEFAFKSVGVVKKLRNHRNGGNSTSPIQLEILHFGPMRRYKVSEVVAYLSSRRSLLHKQHVDCLFVKNQGEGLIAQPRHHYLRPCLSC